jgi:signal transduction histidine kinase
MTERARAGHLGMLAFFVIASVIITFGYAAASRTIVRASIARAEFFTRSVERRGVSLDEALPRIADGLRFPGIQIFTRNENGPIRYDDPPLIAHELVTNVLFDPDVAVKVGTGSIVIAPSLGPLFFVLALLALAGLAVGFGLPALLARFVSRHDRSTGNPAHGIVADVCHELRTPLTVVMGYVDLLHGGRVNDTATQRALYDHVLVECRRMRHLIERVLSLSRMESAPRGTREPLDAASLVNDLVRGLDAPLAARVSADSGATAVVRANADDLREALGNLIQNALRYTSGTVRVTVHERRGVVTISIADDGPGMSADETAQAFERFYRGPDRRSGEGSGLGLAIVKGAVERNGGRISLMSSVGAGTTVDVSFPRCRMSARDPIRAPMRIRS